MARILGTVAAFALVLAVSIAPAECRAATAPVGAARIALTSGGRIFTTDARGEGRVQLSGPSRPVGSDSSPAYSPDGTTIAFVRGAGRRSRIYLMDADGSRKRALTAADRSYVSDPQWSPDGTKLVFARWRSSRSALVSSIVVVAEGGGQERIVARARARRTLSILSQPTWSPSGEQIAFTKTTLDRTAHFRPALYLVGSAGGDRMLLARDASAADFSPDGSRIAFVSVRDRNGESCGEDECSYNGEIYVMNADGSQELRLTHNKGDDEYPDWSADGARIAFASDRNYPEGESPELYSIGADGSCMTWLTNGTVASDEPDWQPRLGASTAPAGCGAIHRKPLIETRIRNALGVEGYRRFWVGREFQHLLLSDVLVGRNMVSTLYDDCASYDPRDCPSSFEIQSWNTCKRFRDIYPGRQRSFPFRGAQAMRNRFAGSFEVYTGRTTVAIFASRAGDFDEHVGRALRRIGSSTIPNRLHPPAKGSLRGKLPCQRERAERFG